jgi:carbon-monoxide dehydrogenase large subunit
LTAVPLPEIQVQFDPSAAHFGASRSQKRLEDDRLLVGKGLFSDDRLFPGQAWLVLVRSPHAHADVRSIDLSACSAAPGVLAAWSMAELRAAGVKHIPFPPLFKRADGSPMAAPLRWPLADGRIYYVGQPVAAIVAQTREQAQDAAELAAIEYEDLPCVVDSRQAAQPGAPLIWPDAPGNIAAETAYGDAHATARAFAAASHVTEIELHNQRLNALALEPRCAIGAVENGRVTLYTQNQTPTAARDLLGATLGGKPQDYRLVNGDIGGGFGMKTGLTPEDVLVCHAARVLARPVKWRAERSEEFLAAHMARDQHYKAALALDQDGKILALRMEMLANIGAVPVGSSAMIPLAMVAKVVTSVYRVPVVDYRCKAVLTNTMATGAYRGAGRPEGNYLMERLLEKAARELKIERDELRRRNLLRPEELPRKTHVGEIYDTGDFPRMLEQVLSAADWKGFPMRREESQRRGKLRGRGLSLYLEWTGALPTETVDIQVSAEGRVTVFSGTQAMGQGLETSYTQLVTELLGIPVDRIDIVQGDTDRATGVGSVGSRSAFVGGSAVVAAGHKVVARGKELAAEALEAAAADIEYRNGRFSIAGTDRSIGLAELAGRQKEKVIRVSATETPSTPSWPNGAQACEVEIDPETGEVALLSMVSRDDIGRIINHAIVEGQIHGGIAQGVGQALFERTVYDQGSGQLLTGSLMDYCAPRADQLPAFHAGFDESLPCKTNLLGVKGCGEIGTIGAVPAVVHAVLDALHGHGIVHLEMPLTSEKLWQALRAA